MAAVAIDSSGNLFSTANYGTSRFGMVFEVVHGSSAFTTLASFYSVGGINPHGGLTFDAAGDLFGTTYSGGSYGDGTVFEIAAGTSAVATLANFNGTNGVGPIGELTVDASGNLFGATVGGGLNGFGTVFEIVHGTTTLTTVASFAGTNGKSPSGGVTLDAAGNLFGATSQGGTGNDGTVFEIVRGTSTITTIASFTGLNGNSPNGGLVFDASGNLFGTTVSGGTNNYGSVFEIARGASAITSVASFNKTNGQTPYAGLTLDSNGNLFGTTYQGGASSVGVVFEIVHGTTALTTVAAFNYSTNGGSPQNSLTLDANQNLFGTTGSTVFEIIHGTNAISTVLPLGGSLGTTPIGRLLLDSSGDLIGTTSIGAAANGGTVFELIPSPPTLSFSTPPALSTAGGSAINGTPGIQVSMTAPPGNVLTNDSSTITLTLNGGVFSTGGNSVTAPDFNGVATFQNLRISAIGNYTLTASSPITGAVTSGSFAITAGPAYLATSILTVGSSAVDIGSSDTITLYAKDASNNPLTGLGVAFHLSNSGASEGTIGSVRDNHDGSYSATFTATSSGTPRSIAATINGALVTSPQPTLTVTPLASLLSITRAMPVGPGAGGSSVSYTVTFSAPVTNVTPANFTVATTGSVSTTGMTLTPLSASVYTVSIGGLSGSGTVGLNFVDYATIRDLSGNPLQSSSASAGTFASQQVLSAGSAPACIVAADLNGDAKPDLIIGNDTAATVTVLLNNSNGTFAAPRTFAVGANPDSIVVADVNGDGYPDLIVANKGAGTVGVLLGDGAGNFASQRVFAVGILPESVTAADVNADGKIDLITANYGSNSISILLGNGDGTFATQAITPVGVNPCVVIAADVNNDGNVDLLTANQGATSMSVLLGNGTGSFTLTTTRSLAGKPTSLVVADFNRDGMLDVLVQYSATGTIGQLLGNGDGTFQAEVNSAVSGLPVFATLADVNGDGIPDLITASRINSNVSVCLGSALPGSICKTREVSRSVPARQVLPSRTLMATASPIWPSPIRPAAPSAC